jgi:hypothetical protein
MNLILDSSIATMTVEYFFKILGIFNIVMQCSMPEVLNPQQQYCENLKILSHFILFCVGPV